MVRQERAKIFALSYAHTPSWLAHRGKQCDCDCSRHDGSFPSRITFAPQSPGSVDRRLRSLHGEPGCDSLIDCFARYRWRSASESDSAEVSAHFLFVNAWRFYSGFRMGGGPVGGASDLSLGYPDLCVGFGALWPR